MGNEEHKQSQKDTAGADSPASTGYIPSGDWQEDLLLEIEQGTKTEDAYRVIARKYHKYTLHGEDINQSINYIRKVYLGI